MRSAAPAAISSHAVTTASTGQRGAAAWTGWGIGSGSGAAASMAETGESTAMGAGAGSAGANGSGSGGGVVWGRSAMDTKGLRKDTYVNRNWGKNSASKARYADICHSRASQGI